MVLLTSSLFLLVGLVLVVSSSWYTVEGLSDFSKKADINPFLVGALVLAIGTGLPEIIDNVFSSLLQVSSLGFGDLVGSSLFNVMMVLAVAALFTNIELKKKLNKQIALMMSGSSFLLAIFLANNVISRLEGLILLTCFGAYAVFLGFSSKEDGKRIPFSSIETDYVLVVLSMFVLVISSWIVVKSAVEISKYFHVPYSLIGATVIAIGTGLPETTNVIISGIQGNIDMGSGTIFGSNIVNLLLAGGIAAIIYPVHVTGVLHTILMGGLVGIGLFGIYACKKESIDKKDGIVLIIGFLIYLATTITKGVH